MLGCIFAFEYVFVQVGCYYLKYNREVAMAKCICLNCKSNNIIPIMYGMPAPKTFEEDE